MSYIILVDMRENNGEIFGISKDDGWGLAQYDTEEEAEELMKEHPLNVFPYEVLDMGLKDKDEQHR